MEPILNTSYFICCSFLSYPRENLFTYHLVPRSPRELILVTISSIAVFDGAHTKTLSIPTATTMDIIPAMVCVFPVPGYNKIFYKFTYRSLDQCYAFLSHVCDHLERLKLRWIEVLLESSQEMMHQSYWFVLDRVILRGIETKFGLEDEWCETTKELDHADRPKFSHTSWERIN